MLTWVIIVVSWWVGYGMCETDHDGSIGCLAAIPTGLTILYLCLVALGLV